ncbi:MAG: hypothetical protein PUC29_06890 [Clostridia bacterium]|nr:hypothetical protein [Clostridia bacterium]
MKNLKNFGITFAVSLVILGIIALFACGVVADTVCGIFDGGNGDMDNMLSPADTSPSAGSDDLLSKKVDGESFTWLWVVSDYRPDVFDDYYPANEEAAKALGDFGTLGKEYRLPSATNLILVRAFVDTREYIIMTIPSVTKISTSAGDYTLGDYYAVAGTSELVSKVEAMTGLQINYCSVIHSTDLSQLANTVGSVECTVPVDIYTDGKNYVSAPVEETTAKKTETTAKAQTSSKESSTTLEPPVVLTKELDRSESVKLAKKLMPALLYYDPSDGIQQEMTIEQSFARGLMANLSDCSDSTLQSMLSSLSGVFVSSNVKTDAIYLHGEVIRAYSWFDVHTVTYPGKFVAGKGGDSSYYKPNLEEGVKYFYNYR